MAWPGPGVMCCGVTPFLLRVRSVLVCLDGVAGAVRQVQHTPGVDVPPRSGHALLRSCGPSLSAVLGTQSPVLTGFWDFSVLKARQVCGSVGADLTGREKYAGGRMPRSGCGRTTGKRAYWSAPLNSQPFHSAFHTGTLSLKKAGVMVPTWYPGQCGIGVFLLPACCRRTRPFSSARAPFAHILPPRKALSRAQPTLSHRFHVFSPKPSPTKDVR
jgi:hypothetical protein